MIVIKKIERAEALAEAAEALIESVREKYSVPSDEGLQCLYMRELERCVKEYRGDDRRGVSNAG